MHNKHPLAQGVMDSSCHTALLMGVSNYHFGTKLTSNSLCENSGLVLMIVVRRFGKLKHILQQCRASASMSEHARSVRPDRLKEILTTGKDIHEHRVDDVIDAAQKGQKCGTTTPSSYLHIDLYTGTCCWLKDEQSTLHLCQHPHLLLVNLHGKVLSYMIDARRILTKWKIMFYFETMC